jgi:hypothetical protein
MTISQNVSCPLVSLKTAVNLAQRIYKIEKAHPATKLDIAKAMNYGNLNGTSYSRIADLIEYGLLESSDGDQLKLTAEALDIVLPTKGDDKRKKAVSKAAFTPPMFHNLHISFEDRLLDNADLARSLENMGLHPNKVSSAVNAYLGTIEFVSEETAGSNIEAIRGKNTKAPTRSTSFKRDNSGSFVKSDSLLSSAFNQKEEADLVWRIAEDCFVQIRFNGRVTQKALQKLVAHLQLSMDDYPTGKKAVSKKD